MIHKMLDFIIIFFRNPMMMPIAAVLSSSSLEDPRPIQADRTFDKTILFITTFVIEVPFLQLKGNLNLQRMT